MAKKDKAKAKPDKTEGEKAKGGLMGKLGLIGTPLLIFGTAFGVSFMSAPPPQTIIAAEEVEKKPVPSELDYPEWGPPEPQEIAVLEPLTLSVGPTNKTLKLGIAIEMATKGLDTNDPRLTDMFTSYLRAVDTERLMDPGYHAMLKEQLLHRARLVLGSDAVQGVLITEFFLTS